MPTKPRDDGYDPDEEDRDTVLDAIAERVADVLEDRFGDPDPDPDPPRKPRSKGGSTRERRPRREPEPEPQPRGRGFFDKLFD